MGETFSLAQYKLHSLTNSYQKKVGFAKNCVAHALEYTECDKWGLSLSFGKDSIALYFLLCEMLNTDVQSVFLASSESYALHNFATVMMQLDVKNLHIIQTDHAETNEGDWVAARKEGHNDIQLIDKWFGDNGFVGTFIGLRKEESKRRRMVLGSKVYGRDNFYLHKMKDGIYHSCPLSEWTLEDVGAWLFQHNAPLLDDYLKYGLAQRTTARATGVSVNYGNTIASLKGRNLNAYNKITAIFPELRSKS